MLNSDRNERDALLARLRGRIGPFTAQPGERYVDADIAAEVLREALAAPAAGGAEGTMVPAAEVFRIAGGDIECSPWPTAKQAMDCLRDLRACYEEALAQPRAERQEGQP